MSKANFNIAIAAENIYSNVQNIFFDSLKEKFSSQNFLATAFVFALHFALLFAALFNFSTQKSQPVLSFSVTMLDTSSSANSFASAASVAGGSNKTTINNNELTQLNSGLENLKQNSVDKNNSDKKSTNLSDSKEQAAVIAPTKAAIFDAAYLNNPSPTYPELSRKLEEQGTVILQAFVTPEGKAEKVAIDKSSGFLALDSAALETVKKWRFIAAQKGEKLVASWVMIPVKFSLEK